MEAPEPLDHKGPPDPQVPLEQVPQVHQDWMEAPEPLDHKDLQVLPEQVPPVLVD
jgi:hypothetical protein